MKLLDLHTLLQDSILTQKPLIDPYLCLPPNGTVADRVAIYTEAFYLRLAEALESDYGTLATLLGDNEFAQLCREYVDTYPSYSYTLDVLGQHMVQFLEETSPYSQQPYWAEIAAFEWAEAKALIAFDARKLLISDLQSVPLDSWPEMRFALHPSATLVTMHWNSLAQIEAVRAEQSIPLPKQKKSYSVLVWRNQLEVRYYTLNPLELTILEAIKAHSSFVTICDYLSKKMSDEEVAPFLVQELYAWINEEVLILP